MLRDFRQIKEFKCQVQGEGWELFRRENDYSRWGRCGWGSAFDNISCISWACMFISVSQRCNKCGSGWFRSIAIVSGTLVVHIVFLKTLGKSNSRGVLGCFCCSVAQSCPTFCNPMDYSSPGSSVHGILQARILEWVAIPFSKGSSWPRNQICISCLGRWVLYHRATREVNTYGGGKGRKLDILTIISLLLQ